MLRRAPKSLYPISSNLAIGCCAGPYGGLGIAHRPYVDHMSFSAGCAIPKDFKSPNHRSLVALQHPPHLHQLHQPRSQQRTLESAEFQLCVLRLLQRLCLLLFLVSASSPSSPPPPGFSSISPSFHRFRFAFHYVAWSIVNWISSSARALLGLEPFGKRDFDTPSYGKLKGLLWKAHPSLFSQLANAVILSTIDVFITHLCQTAHHVFPIQHGAEGHPAPVLLWP